LFEIFDESDSFRLQEEENGVSGQKHVQEDCMRLLGVLFQRKHVSVERVDHTLFHQSKQGADWIV
jgi:hypothetical protein